MLNRTLVAPLAVAAVALGGCGGSSKQAQTDQNHKDFVAGCTHSGAKASMCECEYTRLTARYSQAELEKRFTTPDFRTEAQGIARDCVASGA